VSEPWVNARELARLMGVSQSTIKRLRNAGMPSETWGLSRTRLYQPSRAIEWAQSRGTARIAGSRDRAHNAPGPRQTER